MGQFLFLKRFCLIDSKNVFVLVLAYLEPELEPVNTFVGPGKYICLFWEIIEMKILRVPAIAQFFALFCYINCGP